MIDKVRVRSFAPTKNYVPAPDRLMPVLIPTPGQPGREGTHVVLQQGQLTVEKIDSVQTLRELKDEWEALLAICPHRTPFLSHAWMMTWWKYFGQGKALCVLVVREQGRVVAIAPLMRYRGWFYDRYLKFPSMVIESMANYHSNRVDLIYAEYRDEYLRLMWEYLLNREEWHFLRLYPVAADSPTVNGLQRLSAAAGVDVVFLQDQASPYLTIRGGWEAYNQQLSAEIKRKARRARRLMAENKLSFKLVTQSEDITVVLQQIFEVAEKGWAGVGGTSISSTEQLRGFYTESAVEASRQGWLLLGLLKAGGRPVAYEYNFRYDRTIYNLKIGFDPDFSRLGPGHVLKHLLLSNVFLWGQEDIREYDFLGDTAPYKRKWTQRARQHVKVYLYHPHSAYGRFLRLIQRRVAQPVQTRWRQKRPPLS